MMQIIKHRFGLNAPQIDITDDSIDLVFADPPYND